MPHPQQSAEEHKHDSTVRLGVAVELGLSLKGDDVFASSSVDGSRELGTRGLAGLPARFSNQSVTTLIAASFLGEFRAQ